jgi:hypothetical protein
MFPLPYLFYESFCRGIGTSSAWSLDGMRIGNKDRICTIRGIGLEFFCWIGKKRCGGKWKKADGNWRLEIGDWFCRIEIA